MIVEVSEREGVKLVRLQGELVGGHDGGLVETVTDLLTGPGVCILLDMQHVPYMNSTGLSELVRVTAQANTQEGRIVLAGLSPFVAGVLQASRLDRFFEICPDVETALRRLRA